MSPFEAAIARGVARDIRNLRAQAGMTLEQVTDARSWSSKTELSRFERAIRNISILRYQELLAFYFQRLPKHVKTDHPGVAGLLENNMVALAAESLDTLMLYTYLGWTHASVRTGRLPENDPGEVLHRYLA